MFVRRTQFGSAIRPSSASLDEEPAERLSSLTLRMLTRSDMRTWSPLRAVHQKCAIDRRLVPAWPLGRSGPESLLECAGIRAQVSGTGARVRRNRCSGVGMSARVSPERLLESRRNTHMQYLNEFPPRAAGDLLRIHRHLHFCSAW